LRGTPTQMPEQKAGKIPAFPATSFFSLGVSAQAISPSLSLL
jgi:hypothetical protein